MARRRLPSSGDLRPRLPEPVVRMLRALGMPVAEITRYWAQEARSIRASSTALVIGLGATLVAGVVLGAARQELAEHPGLLVLIPAAIGMRGCIFGALAARLGTGILTGQMGPDLTRDSFLGRQVTAATLLTVATSSLAGVIAWGVSVLFDRPTLGVLELVAVSLVGGLLASAVLLVVTVALARRAQRAGWSMDDVGVPMITSMSDLATLPALLLATFVLDLGWLSIVIGVLGVLAAMLAGVVGWRDPDPVVGRVVRESLVVLTIAVVIDVLAGLVLDTRLDSLLDNPALLVMVPPFVSMCGSLGSILASRLASKLHVGLLEPRAFPSRLAGLDISLTGLLALGGFVGVGVVGWLAALVLHVDTTTTWQLVPTSLVGGLLATFILAAVAHAAAVATFRFGLDPDNHGVPIVTATMDLMGILCLVAAIGLMGAG